MNIIIVGCGKVGEALAEQLNEEGNNLTVIDTDSNKVNNIVNKYDVMGVVGNGAIHSVQKEADIKNADLLVAVTGSDELNLLCCIIARKAGNCKVIARVRNPQYSSEALYLKRELGLAMVINPELDAAAEIARIVRFPSAIKIDTFARGKVELLKFRLPENSPLVGCAVKQIAAKFHSDVLVCTIEREDEAYIPNGDFVFREKDVISMIATPANAHHFFRKIHYVANSIKNIMIVGGGEITHYLCNMLERDNIDVTVVEKKKQRCIELAERFQDYTIIHGDAVDQDILLEEGVGTADAFVALTNLDEENIFLSLFARNAGNAKLITKINRIDFNSVIKELDLDTIIYPKNITSERIVRYVRAMENSIGSNIETLYHIIKGKVEAAEFYIRENSAIVGKTLSELKFHDNVLIATIMRDGKAIIPRGNDTIELGDTVIAVSGHLALHDITDILED